MIPRIASAILTVTAIAAPMSGQESALKKLIDFETDVDQPWYVVNDDVMGGRSASTIRSGEPGIGVFEGYLSLENNGGFASIRTELPAGALVGMTHIRLRVRGDGQRYQLRLRPGRRFDGVAFAAGFDTTPDEWMTVEIPLSEFEPTFRGYRPRRIGPLDPSQIGQIGIMLTDKQVGDFQLEIDWIGALQR